MRERERERERDSAERLTINLTGSISHTCCISTGMRGESEKHISRYDKTKQKNAMIITESGYKPKPNGCIAVFRSASGEYHVNSTTYGGIGVLYNCGGNGAVNRVWQPPGPEVITALYYWYNSITKVLGDQRWRDAVTFSAGHRYFYSLETSRIDRDVPQSRKTRARCFP